jgi:hypothetical protein
MNEPPNNAMQLTRGRLDACGSIIVGNEAIVNEGKVVRPSQLIASVRRTRREGHLKGACQRETMYLRCS